MNTIKQWFQQRRLCREAARKAKQDQAEADEKELRATLAKHLARMEELIAPLGIKRIACNARNTGDDNVETYVLLPDGSLKKCIIYSQGAIHFKSI